MSGITGNRKEVEHTMFEVQYNEEMEAEVKRLEAMQRAAEAARVKIWIDADACPRVIKEILFRASERLRIPVCLVANKNLSRHENGLIESIVVDDGFDVADDYIAEHVSHDDVVITADIPLASRIVAKGAVAIDPRGETYTGDNVGERLSVRDLMTDLRESGLVRGGPPQFGLTDRQRFASSLDRLLTSIIKSGTNRSMESIV